MERIRSHFDLRVYQCARAAAIKVFNAVKYFPADERFGLIQQALRSACAVCGAIAEAWRKRRYPAAFIAKLSDAEAESAEPQTWMDLAEAYGYITKELRDDIVAAYEIVLGQLVIMANQASKWTSGASPTPKTAVSPSLPDPQSQSP